MSTSGSVRRGDIVWVRVLFPHKWWPALVLASDSLGVAVSFFNNGNDTSLPRRFLESEVVPFEDTFPSLMSRRGNDGFRCETFRALLHSALRLFGLRVVSSLRCRCQSGYSPQRICDGSGSRFDPTRVLDFVLDAAVLPWVEAPRLVDAVRVVAQVHSFRDYSSIQQKKVYRETRKLGDNVKQYTCSSLGQKMHSVTQECVALEPKENYQIISKQEEKNMAIGAAIRKLKSIVPVLEGNSEHLFQNKLLIIPETPTNNGKTELILHSPALDPFFMVGEILKSERQSLLRFKNIPDQGVVDICFGNCSTMSSTHFYISSDFKTNLSNYISKRKGNSLGLCCRLPDIETTIYLNRKRRRLDKPALCHVSPQISRVQESEGNACISKYIRPGISHIKILEPEESIPKDNQICIRLCETNMNFTDDVQKVDLKRSQNLTLKQSFSFEPSSNLVLGFCSDNWDVDASAAKFKCILGSNSSIYQKRLQGSCNADTTPLKLKESARMELSSGDCLVKGKDCYQGIASCSIFNAKVGQQSKTNAPLSSTSLHMKFPKNFQLPSKRRLIKKFSVFGSIDSSKTRVFFYTGSAQVAFFQEGDAIAAYHYAKKKVWFGEANVRFWLDPFEHKRIGFQRFSLMPPSANKPTGPPLKSCLKKPNSLRQENRKKHYKVRFTIET
ncbi:hypothetical protein SESBI_51238 [Sesbania bispinosa]|nr:hypothetical protein SESBI_51238 [Sesbania bispinosa]